MARRDLHPRLVRDHRDEYLQLLSEFRDTGNGHFGGIKKSKPRIDQTSDDIRPVHSASYRAGPAARHFAEKGIQKMLQKAVVPANTEWARSIVFSPEKGDSLSFYVNHRLLKKMTVRD